MAYPPFPPKNNYSNISFCVADKIQISKTTWLMLSMKGGYIMEERGVIEVKVKHSLSNIQIIVQYECWK